MKKMKSSNKVPPEGGYGWVIVFANALSNFITMFLVQCFGLIIKDTFIDLNLSATQSSLIISLNAAFGKLMGPIIGVLLKIYGCRKVGMMSAFLLTLGMVVTSFSRSFAYFVIAYGIITSSGMQMSETTHRLALNMYFVKKRNIATGFAVTIAGLGPVLMPQFVRFLMKIYTGQEVTLIVGGICGNMFIAAILLQPVEWHMRKQPVKQNEEEVLMKLDESKPQEDYNYLQRKTDNSVWKRLLHSITKTFDLDLLKDPIFDNILLGMAFATFAELSFTLLIPFILHDFGLSTDQIAIFLSTLGVADIIFRFIGPYIGDYFTKPPRFMYVYSLALLVMIRFSLLLSKNFYVLLLIAIALGIAKGVRKVYMWLVVPAHVPIDKLPSASGMETLAIGMCVLIGGPILGALRDATGSYVICIVVMNCVTIATIILWGIEAIIVKFKTQKSCENTHNIMLKMVTRN